MPTSQEPQTLAESLEQYEASVPEDERLDALHRLFYGFYGRVAIVDRTTHELARWARDDLAFIDNLTATQGEALRDNALHVGQDLFGARMRAMTAMRLVSARMAELREPGEQPGLHRALGAGVRRGVGTDPDVRPRAARRASRPAVRPVQLRPGRRVSATR